MAPDHGHPLECLEISHMSTKMGGHHFGACLGRILNAQHTDPQMLLCVRAGLREF